MTPGAGPHGRIIGIHRETHDRRETPLTLVLVQCASCHRLVDPAVAARHGHTREWVCRNTLVCFRHRLANGRDRGIRS